MSIGVSSVYSDIEKKITDFLRAQITDPKSAERPSSSPFVVIAAKLRRKQFFPHVIVQVTDMHGNMFAMGSDGQIFYPIVQLSIYSTSKKQLNEIKDEILYDMAVGRPTIRGYGLDRMVINSSGSYTYDEELGVHGFWIRYEFVYHHLPI